MILTILDVFSIINLLIYFYIAIAMARKWKISKAHRRFFFLAVFSFLWILTRFFENIFIQSFDLLIHIDFSLAALVAGMVAIFALHFPRNNPSLSFRKELVLYFPIIVLSLLSFTDLFVNPGVYREVDYMPGYYVYITILIIYFIFIGDGTFIKKYIKSSGITRQQLVYILIGYLTAIVILLYDSISNSVIGPPSIVHDKLFFNSSIIFSALIAYTVLRYRLMDIKVVIRKGLIYGLSLIIGFAFYTYLAILGKNYLQNTLGLSEN